MNKHVRWVAAACVAGVAIGYATVAMMSRSFEEARNALIAELILTKSEAERSMNGDRICGNITIDHALNRAYHKLAESADVVIDEVKKKRLDELPSQKKFEDLRAANRLVIEALHRCKAWFADRN